MTNLYWFSKFMTTSINFENQYMQVWHIMIFLETQYQLVIIFRIISSFSYLQKSVPPWHKYDKQYNKLVIISNFMILSLGLNYIPIYSGNWIFIVNTFSFLFWKYNNSIRKCLYKKKFFLWENEEQSRSKVKCKSSIK